MSRIRLVQIAVTPPVQTSLGFISESVYGIDDEGRLWQRSGNPIYAWTEIELPVKPEGDMNEQA